MLAKMAAWLCWICFTLAGLLRWLCWLLLTMLDIISGWLYRLCLLDIYSGSLAMPDGRLEILAGFPGYSLWLCSQC
jgi:hypothetical protein